MTMVRQFDDDEKMLYRPIIIVLSQDRAIDFFVHELFKEKLLCSSCSSLANCVNYILLYNDLMLYVQVEQLP